MLRKPPTNIEGKTVQNGLLKALNDLPVGSVIRVQRTRTGIKILDRPLTKSQIIEARFSHLQGSGIAISEAADKYNVPRGAIQGWAYQSGDVSFVDTESYPKLVDEADIAICSNLYHIRQEIGLTGVPYFDSDGYPITTRQHPGLAEYRKRKKQDE